MADTGDNAPKPKAPLLSAVVHQWHCDHFGHLNVRNYAAFFDDAIFVFWSRFGVGRDDDKVIPVTAELKIGFQREVLAGTVVDVQYRITRIGGKSVGVTFEMVDAASDEKLATCDVVEVFFGSETRQSAVIPDAIRDRLAA